MSDKFFDGLEKIVYLSVIIFRIKSPTESLDFIVIQAVLVVPNINILSQKEINFDVILPAGSTCTKALC